ncbi:MAG: hypothetical protein R3200_17395 [Xanthomonadales bacterium]|nr:hypothetical protein [Xanthomonadales bacterium]
MSDDYTKEGLLKFLKEAAMAGLLNPATARSRRTAAEQLLTQLNDTEQADLREVDVDELCSRFHKLQGSSIRPEALKIYNNRLKSALADYFRYLENPDDFVSVGGENRQLRKRTEGARSEEERALEEIRLEVAERPLDILPIPIRSDTVVYVQNLPLDLTPEEARKVARVVEALADEGSEDKG